MRGNETDLALGSAIIKNLNRRNGVTREKIAASGVCEDEGVIGQCADIVFAALTQKGEIVAPTTKLIDDGPGDEVLIAGIDCLRLLPILTDADGEHISYEEAIQRGRSSPATNWGQRAAIAVCDAGNACKIPLEVWPVGVYAFFSKTICLDLVSGHRFAWLVSRHRGGFSRYYGFLYNNDCSRNGRFPSLAT